MALVFFVTNVPNVIIVPNVPNVTNVTIVIIDLPIYAIDIVRVGKKC